MGIVIAVFIITAIYVGYYAFQEHSQEGEAHHISPEPNVHSLVLLQNQTYSDQIWIN